MKRMVPLMNDACDTFMKKLEKVADKDESCDIHKYLNFSLFISIVYISFCQWSLMKLKASLSLVHLCPEMREIRFIPIFDS